MRLTAFAMRSRPDHLLHEGLTGRRVKEVHASECEGDDVDRVDVGVVDAHEHAEHHREQPDDDCVMYKMWRFS